MQNGNLAARESAGANDLSGDNGEEVVDDSSGDGGGEVADDLSSSSLGKDVIQFFNDCEARDLADTAGISEDRAVVILSHRPFHSLEAIHLATRT